MGRRSHYLVGILVFSFACVKRPLSSAPLNSDEKRELENRVTLLSRQAESLIRAQDELVWKGWTEGSAIDIERTYRGESTLFSLSSIKTIERSRSLKHSAAENLALKRLYLHFVGEYLSSTLRDTSGAIANVQASSRFRVNEKEYAYRDLDYLIRSEGRADQRLSLYRASSTSVERLSQSIQRREEKLAFALATAGIKSYQAFGEDLRESSLIDLSILAEEVLAKTEKSYLASMQRLAQKEFHRPLSEVRVFELPRLFRTQYIDKFFPKDQLLPRAFDTLRQMGMDLSLLPQIKIDSSEAPGKSPHALALAVVFSTDVRLSAKPAAGFQEQESFFHALGHALFAGLAWPDRFELTRLGNPTVPESYALLIRNLVDEPQWLEENTHLNGQLLNDQLALSAARQLYSLRRAAGLLIYQLKFHNSNQADAEELFSQSMRRALGVQWFPEDSKRCWIALEDFYQSADAFRAQFLAGLLGHQLAVRFGSAWWKNSDSGAFLKSLMARGNAVSISQFLSMIGETTLRPEHLLFRLSSREAAQ